MVGEVGADAGAVKISGTGVFIGQVCDHDWHQVWQENQLCEHDWANEDCDCPLSKPPISAQVCFVCPNCEEWKVLEWKAQ